MTTLRQKGNVSGFLSCGLLAIVWLLWDGAIHPVQCEPGKSYVGAKTCKTCHEKEYKNFTAYSKKNHSFKSITARKKGLTEEEFRKCFECHTTGYGKPGGFRSEAETPDLQNLGCEVCHGPGSLHAKTGNPEDIKARLTAKDCEVCHNSERVAAFKYKPLIYGGAH